MLDHHEERQLADIEAHLRDEAPDLLELFDEIPDITEPIELAPTRPQGGPEAIERETIGHTGHTTTHPVLKSIAGLVAAVVLTTLVTLTVGPDLGGLIAVIGLSIAGMYAYQVLRGCPGLRDRHRDA
jgi:hypothetical protein